jgi:hypothetical protein
MLTAFLGTGTGDPLIRGEFDVAKLTAFWESLLIPDVA